MKMDDDATMTEEKMGAATRSVEEAIAGAEKAPSGFLAEMEASARERVERARAARPLLRTRARSRAARHTGISFAEALRRSEAGEPRAGGAGAAPQTEAGSSGAARAAGLAIIAEIKRASPSKGVLAADLDAVVQAERYEAAGADAISVLTEPDRFHGSLDDLRAVAAAVSLPVLRKDFIVDEYQLWEAAEAGAAAVLLIAALLDIHRLAWLLGEAVDLGLDVLLEVHDERDLRIALELEAPIVGINNRDLATLQVDLATTERLAPLLRSPGERLVVAESGVTTAADAARMRAAGADAILVGEALVRTGYDAAMLSRPSHEPLSGEAGEARVSGETDGAVAGAAERIAAAMMRLRATPGDQGSMR